MARLITKQEAARLLDVSTQTVSNWLDKGYIKGHEIDNRLMVDRETIEKYFDSLQDLACLEKTVVEKIEYLQQEDVKLSYEIHEVLYTRDKIEEAPRGVYRDIVRYATMDAQNLFTEKQQKVFHRMLNMERTDTIAKELGLSRSRVVEIYYHCLRKIATIVKLANTQEKWDNLEHENQRLKLLIASQQKQMDSLRSTISSNPSLLPLSDIEKINKALDAPISDFKFNVKSMNVLNRLGCSKIRDVICLTRDKLLSVNQCGQITVDNIENVLKQNGYALGVDISTLLLGSNNS